jgi:murein DD-endopeptidase MepM/ murein hydrolase activator NlpD
MRERTGTVWAVLMVSTVIVTTLPVFAASPRKTSPRAVHQRQGGANVSTASPATQKAPSNPTAALSQVQAQLASRRKRLAEVVRQERSALVQLSGAQERLERATAHLHETSMALADTQRAVDSATRSLQAVSTRLAAHERRMAARVRAFYERGPVGYLDVLLDATDLRDFLTRSFLVSRVVERDVALYHTVAAERQQRQSIETALASHQEELTAEQDQWNARQEETARLTEERRKLLEQVRVERRTQEAAIRELEVESARIAEIIRQLARRGRGPILTLRNGALLWPVSGRITSGWGWRIHPIFGTREFHTGIDIAAPYGTPIQAAEAGTVIFDGWMRGYGMLVILDHGGGLTTTYSHLSASLVRMGEHADRGAIIAKIGSTGWSTGPHLFFEVREDGQPVNPLGQ